MRWWTIFGLAVAVAACRQSAPGTQTEQESAAAAAPHVAIELTATQREGRILFESVCWTCHGKTGRGDGPAVQAGSVPAPPSFMTEEYARATPEQLERRFRQALEGGDPSHPHMQYVVSVLKPDRFKEALAYIPALAYPPEIPGSALSGQAQYEVRCVGCHGESGSGDGPAAELLQVAPPANFHADSLLANRDFDAVFRRIREGGRAVHGSSMPPWGVALSEGEIWDLVAYLSTFQPGLVSPPSK